MSDIDQRDKYRLILEIQKVGKEIVRKAGNPIRLTVDRSYYLREDNNGKH